MFQVNNSNIFTGTTCEAPQEYELLHRALARRAAAEGIVLLKNEADLLPLKPDTRVALFGAGATRTVKGGTGSGDVNERDYISIYQGLKAAGYSITTEKWIQDYETLYTAARLSWREEVHRKLYEEHMPPFNAYSSTPFPIPVGPKAKNTDTDTAIFVLARNAGEGLDRTYSAGDYLLAEEEHQMLDDICSYYRHVIVVINAGGPVDLSFLDEYPNIQALLHIVQPGMEGGNAFADVLGGKVTPCGKLTDTWALHYGDYPNAATFSHNDGNVSQEYYEEGIYVGYRYFDTFDVPVRYPFGYGLSYTQFRITTKHVCVTDGTLPEVRVSVEVKNIGHLYSGREIVQVYVSAPDGRLPKEYRRLCGFAKTALLAPQESQVLEISFPLCHMASYDEDNASWLLESGFYGIWAGASLPDSTLCAMLRLDEEKKLTQLANICPLQQELHELEQDPQKRQLRYEAWSQKGLEENVPVILLVLDNVQTECIDYSEPDTADEINPVVESLEVEQLIQLATGVPANLPGNNLGSSGISVPGSAGETSSCAIDKGIPNIILADGPAGLRLNKTYYVKDGKIVPLPFEASLEGGFLCPDFKYEGEKYYQFCTAFPVGTLLAQTWDTALVQEVGAAVSEEMQRFHVTLWLAPGMNIHRNPLCGRNFEYYSEDPFLSGKIAAAMTQGVQSLPGCGTTIKHFACNNQEDNRMGSDSILSERALREIYLKGFEIAVKEAHPMSIMTSYNLINGVHSANNHDLCTKAARREWGFDGVIMTDWCTTEVGDDCTAAGCMNAGNDLVMPGQLTDHENLREALENGKLTEERLRRCVGRLVRVILRG